VGPQTGAAVGQSGLVRHCTQPSVELHFCPFGQAPFGPHDAPDETESSVAGGPLPPHAASVRRAPPTIAAARNHQEWRVVRGTMDERGNGAIAGLDAQGYMQRAFPATTMQV
jgi:hypothetical protein